MNPTVQIKSRGFEFKNTSQVVSVTGDEHRLEIKMADGSLYTIEPVEDTELSFYHYASDEHR